MAHEDYKAMLPARALSALDAGEAQALNQHLAECAECREELASWERTASALALDAKPMEPSPEVRQRIMSAVREEKDTRDEKHARADNDARVLPFAPVRRNVWRSLGAIAAVVLFLALLVGLVVLWQQNRTLRQQNELANILSEPGSRLTELKGTAQASTATAKLAYARDGRALLLATNLPPAPAGKEYQLWFIVGSNPPLPGKSFAPDSAGRSTLRDKVPRQALDSAVFAITLEPAGGVDAPTGQIYLSSGF
ncbi:MAG TPA: anti-sigma factor [Pyrinomonadaceae bacterium]|nr:anti-sigma factor [Pyrinomonadaceae bacterium]